MISLLIALFNAINNSKIIFCDIKGNVKNPGVYQMHEGDLIIDLIEKSGGLEKNSYVKNINLSKKVSDEMVIYILSIEEYNDLIYTCPVCICEEKECSKKEVKENTTTKEIKTSNIPTATTTVTTKEDITTKPIEITTIKKLININTADVSELMRLSGIGEKIAIKIINYREVSPFITIEDIKNVSGIGESKYEKIKEKIKI